METNRYSVMVKLGIMKLVESLIDWEVIEINCKERKMSKLKTTIKNNELQFKKTMNWKKNQILIYMLKKW